MKIERMFSNVEEERLYSTGNDELNELLERAFCEGYEYAQKEFATKNERRQSKRKYFEEIGSKSPNGHPNTDAFSRGWNFAEGRRILKDIDPLEKAARDKKAAEDLGIRYSTILKKRLEDKSKDPKRVGKLIKKTVKNIK